MDQADSSYSSRCGVHKASVQSDGVSGERGAAGLCSRRRDGAGDHLDEGWREAVQHRSGVPHTGRAALGDITQVQNTQSINVFLLTFRLIS